MKTISSTISIKNRRSKKILNIQKPITINQLTIKNRLVLPPMAVAKAGASDEASNKVIDYYSQRAKLSGIGLIITEHLYIHKQGKAHPGQMSIATDDAAGSFVRLTDAVHTEGVKIFAQLSHAGTAASSAVTGTVPVGPSPIFHPTQRKEMPEELTKDQILEIVRSFTDAAIRAKNAGFDGIEIHSAHGYLLNQFYSPLYNHRTDEYGCDTMENRIRIHLEIIQSIRGALGAEYPIAIRMGGCDYQEGGTSIADTVDACKLLEKSGVDLLDITGGMNGFVRPGHTEAGYFRDISTAVKEQLDIPVLLTGGVKSAEEAEALLQEQCADMIGIGRILLKDPQALHLS